MKHFVLNFAISGKGGSLINNIHKYMTSKTKGFSYADNIVDYPHCTQSSECNRFFVLFCTTFDFELTVRHVSFGSRS